MRPPEPDLAAVVDGLGLPHPERARILEEIAADLEEMRGELVRRGWNPDEASAEAVRLLAPSEAAVAALASVHEPLYASLVRRFSSGMRWAEWAGLVGVTLVVLGPAVVALVSSGLLDSPSPALVPVLASAVFVIAMAGRTAIRLYVARDHEPERLHDGMGGLLMGSSFASMLGFGGAAYETLGLAGRLELAPERAADLLVPWLMDASVLIGAGLVTALVGGLAWFFLQRKISAVEGADLRANAAVRRAAASSSLQRHPTLTSPGVLR